MAKDLNKQLFKKILLSFFPKNQMIGGMNPTGMFVSFISTKQFFSLVNRKIVENYKLNLFDIALDPFEVKVGFGDTPGVGIKEIDPYYGYCSAANLNGYRFFSPGIIATTITMVAAVYTQDAFTKKQNKYFLHFLYTVYLLAFVFTARLKKFPEGNREKRYKWFVEVFFNFFEFVFHRTNTTYNVAELKKIKLELLKNVELFMCLLYFYEHMGAVFNEKVAYEVHSWLFFDELRKKETKKIFEEFLQNDDEITEKPIFTPTEKIIIDKILPADIIVRYLFLSDDELFVTRHLVSKIYDRELLDTYMRSFLEGDDQWQDFVEYITNFKNIRNNFFQGAQAFTRHKFRLNAVYDHDTEEEINEFMSSVEDLESLEGVKVPERIRKESDVMEKLLNFYVTFVGGMGISRGDNFHARLFKRPLLGSLVTADNLIGHKQDNLYYFGGILYSYSKNVFYYKYAFDNIRAGKDKFMLPFKAKFKEVYSNMFIVKQLDENFVTTLLQEFNHQDIKIYAKSQTVLDRFRQQYGEQISSLVSMPKAKILTRVYLPLQKLVGEELPLLAKLKEYIDDNDIKRLKDHTYQLDFWIFQSTYVMMTKMKKKFLDTYSSMVIMGIISTMRDTFFGFNLYIHYLKSHKNLSEKDVKTLCLIYFTDVVNMHEEFFDDMFAIFNKIQTKFSDYFNDRVLFDDNANFFSIGYRNWKKFTKENEEVIANLSGEDVVWFRGYLKNITYYNKRYLVPS